MTRLIVRGFTVSLDGYGAGPKQSLESPLGIGGETLHDWLVTSRTFKQMLGMDGGETGIDDDFAVRSMTGIGAWILGRNMFGPIRGPWTDDSWRGWWGDNPPYHSPVFVLSHYERQPLVMEGGTVFHFVSDGIYAALERAKHVAGGQDIRLLGGTATIRQYVQARLVDEIHLAVSPILLGAGEHLLAGIDLPALGYKITECIPTSKAVHYTISRAKSLG